jgi:hypothetical protein
MLDEDVVQAVRDGRFAVWPITDVDDAIRLMSSTPDAFGTAIEARVGAFAETARAYDGLVTRTGDGATARRSSR